MLFFPNVRNCAILECKRYCAGRLYCIVICGTFKLNLQEEKEKNKRTFLKLLKVHIGQREVTKNHTIKNLQLQQREGLKFL